MNVPPIRDKIWVFRMVHYENLAHILEHGIYCRRSPNAHEGYVNIGSTEIIDRRSWVAVKCDPGCVINDYVPFYFGVRTPMLYKIHTGKGIPKKPQEDIVYLCCRFSELVESKLEWCYTDGNAATDITKFFTQESDLVALDWHSIHSADWSDNNKDGDHDRIRKKMSEFLIKGHLPREFIRAIVVRTEERAHWVQQLVDSASLAITVVHNKPNFYFS